MKRGLYFGLLGLLMFCSGLYFSFQDESRTTEIKYKLVYSFYDWWIVGCPGTRDILIFNYFLCDDPATSFNVDLLVCCDKKGNILHIRKVNEKGQWQITEKIPAGLPYEEIRNKIINNLEAILKILEDYSPKNFQLIRAPSGALFN